MKPGNAIEVKDLKITYKCVKSLSMRKSLFHLRKSKLEVYEALRGISFEVKKGEIMGIVGKNGSGKSTLLRAIAGIFSADSGSIELESDSVSLLSIGVGFQKLFYRECCWVSRSRKYGIRWMRLSSLPIWENSSTCR